MDAEFTSDEFSKWLLDHDVLEGLDAVWQEKLAISTDYEKTWVEQKRLLFGISELRSLSYPAVFYDNELMQMKHSANADEESIQGNSRFQERY